MEIWRFIFFQILIKIWDTLASSCIATSNFWNVHCLLPVWVRMNQSAEMCTCGQYIELCSLVLCDQIEISNLLCLFSGITLWIFFLPLFKKLFYFILLMKLSGWWLHTYLKWSNRILWHISWETIVQILSVPGILTRWPKCNLLTSCGCDYNVFMNLFPFHLLFVSIAVKCTFYGVSLYWKI